MEERGEQGHIHGAEFGTLPTTAQTIARRDTSRRAATHQTQLLSVCRECQSARGLGRCRCRPLSSRLWRGAADGDLGGERAGGGATLDPPVGSQDFFTAFIRRRPDCMLSAGPRVAPETIWVSGAPQFAGGAGHLPHPCPCVWAGATYPTPHPSRTHGGQSAWPLASLFPPPAARGSSCFAETRL